MSQNLFNLLIISPVQELYSGKAVSLIADAQDGEIGIFAEHAPLVSALRAGKLRLTIPSGEIKEFKIKQGFIHISKNRVNALIYQD